MSNNTKKLKLESSLPSVVTIFGKDFKVSITALKGLLGDCDTDSKVIRIHQNQTKNDALNTLFHEMLHAAFGISGIREILKEDQEEAIVRMIEHAFADAMDVYKLAKKDVSK